MKCYHGTSEEKWKLIQEEGVLWGYNTYTNPDGSTYRSYRYTYLSPDLEISKNYGNIVLEIDYEPTGITGIDNYGFDPPEGETCWQFSVFIPIELNKVKRII